MVLICDMAPHGARMALRVKEFRQRYNENNFLPWRSCMTWCSHGALMVLLWRPSCEGFSSTLE